MPDQATLNTGDISRRIGLTVTTQIIEDLGFQPVGKDKRASLWAESDYPKICKARGAHIAGKGSVSVTPDKPPANVKDTKPAATAVEDDDGEI